MNQVMDFIAKNGGDEKSVYYRLAKEKGVDPEAFLEQVRSITGL